MSRNITPEGCPEKHAAVLNLQQSIIVAAPSLRRSWFSFADCCIQGIEYHRSDSSPALALFLHGRYCDSTFWESTILEVGAAARTLAIDLPGFGHSYSIRRGGLSLIESVKLVERMAHEFSSPDEPVVLIGHDIGGTIALMSSAYTPNRISGVVLINPACLTRPAEGLECGWMGWKQRLRLKIHCEDSSLSSEALSLLREPWQRSSSRRSRATALRVLGSSWPGHYERLAWKAELRKMNRPALLLWGTRDRLNPPSLGAELMRQLPNAEFLEDTRSSHWLPLENPTWVGSKLREFLFRVGARLHPAA